jgi:hypothetical protein
VRLSRAADTEVRVDYRTVSRGGATEGSDYLGTSGTLRFAPGERQKTVTVTIIGDTEDESDESFGFVISDPVGATLGFSSANGVIADDDP